jgi:putative ABC transport system permease protein
VTILAIAALAMAIGATTGVFSVVNALLFRSLPFHEPERLVAISELPVTKLMNSSAFHEWASSRPYLEDAAIHTTREMNVSRSSDAVRVMVSETSFNYLSLLGAETEIGRTFAQGEDAPGHDLPAVISYSFWQQFFGGDPRALGTSITVNGTPATIVGVMRAGFDSPSRTAVWTPTAFELDRIGKQSGGIFFGVTGRLKRGWTIAAGLPLLKADTRRLVPEFDFEKHPGEYPRMTPMRDALSGPVRQASLVLMGVVASVLLIACANLANLLLSRVAERTPEMAVRAAMGASRARLAQQLVTESVMLSLTAAIAGLAIAQWVAKLAMSVQPARLESQAYTLLDWRVLAFTVTLAALTGILFGVVPAWLSSRIHPSGESLQTRANAYSGRAGKMRQTLIAVEVALALVLLAGSFVMGGAFLKLLGTDLGFRTDHLVTMSVSTIGTRYQTPAQLAAFEDQALEKLRAIPGVESAGAIQYVPLGDFAFTPFAVFKYKLDTGEDIGNAPIAVSSNVFQTMGIQILAGRELSPEDRIGSPPAVVVNEAFARNFGSARAAVGHTVWSTIDSRRLTIVGVVRNIAYAGPEYAGTGNGTPQMFIAGAQTPPQFLTFVAKVRGTTASYVPVCRDAVQSIDRQVAWFQVESFDERLRDLIARPRFYTIAIVFLGGFAMLLAVIGIYAVASYSVSLRMHEIGVRIAVGATAAGVRRMILRQALLPVALGAVAGLAGAAAMGQYLQHLVASAQPASLSMRAAAALTLAATAAIATWSATRRVSRLDPMVILRSE